MNTLLVNVANAIMSRSSAVSGLLAKEDFVKGGKFYWVTQLVEALNNIITPALIVLSAAGAVYAVILGVKMAQADNQEARDTARKSMINLIISIIAILVLIAIFKVSYELIQNIKIDDVIPPTT